jgi:hypothetical protein
MRESERKTQGWAESLMTNIFCLCAGGAIGFSTRLGKKVFGVVATRFYGRAFYATPAFYFCVT